MGKIDGNKLMPNKEDGEPEYCRLPRESYATINGVRTKARTGEKIPVKVHWICYLSEGRPVFSVLDGVTGYEDYLVSSLLGVFYRHPEKTGFAACIGCDVYDRLTLDGDEVKAVLEKLVEIYKIEVDI